uniref:Sodium/calcium exchanger membrane region domain-containing protein n=1 Tax=Timema tahoe TaxID=61484 RepID=A0A7R9NW21_9NEOP|nr:unnamed protein product [Timema tahoe]
MGRSRFESWSGRKLLWQGGNCTPPAILDFPPDLFTPEQRRAGAAVLHGVLACYLFVLLAIVCDDYFVPSIKRMCSSKSRRLNVLGMSDDVAGATFMAAATSSPELFINSVGTFITEGDIGVGTIVGSAVFNILAVPACCGLFAGQVSSRGQQGTFGGRGECGGENSGGEGRRTLKRERGWLSGTFRGEMEEVLKLDWWPLTRDCLMYGITVVVLILTLNDERVEWYEALMLVSMYILYISAMYFNTCMSDWVKGCCRGRHRHVYRKIVVTEETSPLLMTTDKDRNDSATDVEKHAEETKENNKDDEDEGESRSTSYTVTCIITVTGRSTSYNVTCIITVTGDTLGIPDSVVGITFLAAGTSVPEAVSSVIVTNQGHGSMGISNSIGSNTFDILLCLGLPWLIKSTFLPVSPGEHFVIIHSSGLEYNAISLLSTLLILYVSFASNDFKLDRKIGIVCLLIYIGFLTSASLIELNFFFLVNLPTCPM